MFWDEAGRLSGGGFHLLVGFLSFLLRFFSSELRYVLAHGKWLKVEGRSIWGTDSNQTEVGLTFLMKGYWRELLGTCWDTSGTASLQRERYQQKGTCANIVHASFSGELFYWGERQSFPQWQVGDMPDEGDMPGGFLWHITHLWCVTWSGRTTSTTLSMPLVWTILGIM